MVVVNLSTDGVVEVVRGKMRVFLSSHLSVWSPLVTRRRLPRWFAAKRGYGFRLFTKCGAPPRHRYCGCICDWHPNGRTAPGDIDRRTRGRGTHRICLLLDNDRILNTSWGK